MTKKFSEELSAYFDTYLLGSGSLTKVSIILDGDAIAIICQYGFLSGLNLPRRVAGISNEGEYLRRTSF